MLGNWARQKVKPGGKAGRTMYRISIMININLTSRLIIFPGSFCHDLTSVFTFGRSEVKEKSYVTWEIIEEFV